MLTKLTRRQALLAGAASAALVGCATPRPGGASVEPASQVFAHGIASGDMDERSVVLWTRISPAGEGRETVTWDIAGDDSFSMILASGEIVTGPERDWTVKAIPSGLQPGTRYFYRFQARGETSQTGRTMTLPDASLDTLGIALASCSNYAFGFFNAYDAIARDEAVDVVLHTGDYIYEYGGKEGWGHETATAIGRQHEPAHEIVTLADYRQRHAQYKSDAGSRAMHAAKPLLCCWDDHESTNNPWMGGASNHQPETEGDWRARRAASIQAYYEWMPIREPQPGMSRKQFWRTYRFGELATLVTLETRHTGRGKQVDYTPWLEQIRTREDRDRLMAEVMGDPSRTMLSPEMEAHLAASLSSSTAEGQPWRIIGNASPIARMLVPDLAEFGIEEASAPNDGARFMLWKGKWNLPFYTDTWDGYPVARESFYELCARSDARDLLVLTGDSHSFWANELFDGSGQRMGVEIGTAGISSPGDFVETGWSETLAEKLDRSFEKGLDEVVWTDNLHQGYVRIVLGSQEAEVTYRAVDTVLSPQYRAFDLKTVRVIRQQGSLVYG